MQTSQRRGLANINCRSGLDSNGNQYTQSGSGPTLDFFNQNRRGNLTLRINPAIEIDPLQIVEDQFIKSE